MVGGTKCFVAKAAFCERFSIGFSDPVLEQIITEALSPESFISDYQRKKEIALASLNADSKS